MSLDEKINSYLKSPEGKKKITEAKVKALKAGKSFGGYGGSNSFSTITAEEAAKKMKEILIEKLAEVNLGSIDSEDIIIQDPTVNPDGTITVGLSFDAQSVKRPSLAPDLYDGVENIVVHLTHGWSARRNIRGYWESAGMTVWSRRKFDGNDFMQRAIDEFNSLKLGVAEIDDKYLT